MADKTVLAVDPGSSKCGIALVKRHSADEKLEILYRIIAPVEHIGAIIHKALAIEQFNLMIVGGGTGSKRVIHQLREQFPSMGLLIVDERDTSLQARERYWEYHPRKGLRRLFPATLQVPPDPIDDFVALILAERVLMGD